MTRKPKTKSEKGKAARSTADAADDRHLPHPHNEPADPAGGAVFDDEGRPPEDDGKPCEEPRPAEGDPDAIGFTVAGEMCTEPDDDDGTGVGAVMEDDCDPPAAGAATAATAQSRPARVEIATAATASAASAPDDRGSAVFPDGRVAGTDDGDSDIREGFGLVFPE